MAFFGPGPFDGDPAWDFWNLELAPDPDRAHEAFREALAAVVEADDEIELDAGVRAWVAAELVAASCGFSGEGLPPEFEGLLARGDFSDLAALAGEAVDAIVSLERSELAVLWEERDEGSFDLRLAILRSFLEDGARRKARR